MLRAVLLGVLTLTAVSCKSHDAATSASQTVAAGKVIEVVGTVTLHHGSDTRPLAKGDMIDADDIVETGADGSAVIENQNNNVNWELGANKKGKLRDALAWTAPKKQKGAKAVDQDSTAAGRHAERSAADNSVSATAPAETERQDMPAKNEEAKADSKAAIVAPITAQGAVELGREAPGGAAPAAPAPTMQPPPPPTAQPASPPPPPKATAKSAPPPSKSAHISGKIDFDDGEAGTGGLGLSGAGEGGGGVGEGTIGLGQIGTIGKGGGGGTGQGYGAGGGSLGSTSHASPNVDATKLVHTKDSNLKACFKAGTTVHVRITVDADGKAKVFFTEKVTDEQKTCVQNVVDKLEFAKTVAMVATAIKA